MMNPADQPQLIEPPRSTDPPTLWVSLALGSVLIHLVFFMSISFVLTRDAKVQLDLEPIAVEFVDPNAARSAASGGAIAVRPGSPSSTRPSSTQVQPNAPLPSSVNQPIEPLIPPQPVKPVRTRQPQQNLTREPVSPPPSSRRQPQPAPSSNLSQGGLSGAPSGKRGLSGATSQGGLPGAPSGSGAQQPSEPQQPATSNVRIAEPPQGGDVVIDLKSRQPYNDPLTKAASIPSPITASIQYSPRIAQALRQGVNVTVSLDIDQSGFVREIFYTKLGSTESAIDQATLDGLADQIFKERQFEPAQADPGGLTIKPRRSNLIIEARIRLL